MSTNEDPMGAPEPAGAATDPETLLLDDDVEGHGMREVAAGLGAAAILAGGGSALAATASVSTPHLGAPTPSVSNPVASTDHTTDWAIAEARDTRDAAVADATSTATGTAAAAGHAVTATSATASNVAAGAEHTTAAVLDASGNLVRTEARTVGQTAGDTTAAAIRVERAAVTTTNAVASGATQTTTHTASSATTDTVRKAATALQLSANTVNALETTIVATVQSLNPQAGMGASGMGSTGWVTFSLGGQTLASVQVHDGQATITVKTAQLAGQTLQAVYSGDSVHASSTNTL